MEFGWSGLVIPLSGPEKNDININDGDLNDNCGQPTFPMGRGVHPCSFSFFYSGETYLAIWPIVLRIVLAIDLLPTAF